MAIIEFDHPWHIYFFKANRFRSCLFGKPCLGRDLTISFCFSGDISALDPVDTLAPPRAELADNKPKKMKELSHMLQ